jgi:hypothetical protein
MKKSQTRSQICARTPKTGESTDLKSYFCTRIRCSLPRCMYQTKLPTLECDAQLLSPLVLRGREEGSPKLAHPNRSRALNHLQYRRTSLLTSKSEHKHKHDNRSSCFGSVLDKVQAHLLLLGSLYMHRFLLLSLRLQTHTPPLYRAE